MSPFQWVLLGLIFTFYLLFGGTVFMVLEQEHELQQHSELAILRKDIRDILLGLDQEFYSNGTTPEIIDAIRQAKENVILRISESCGKNNLLEENSTVDPLRWTFYNSVFFAFTAITTVGYGNLAPDTHWSRIFTIFYALFGIPINGIILTNISDIYSRRLLKVQNRAGSNSRLTFACNIIFYLIPGLLLFIIIPAAFFVVIENWAYLDAIYFSFVTLTTIGFGDYVAGMGDGHNFWHWVYKIAIIFWIVFGLAYLVMILGFITKGITSKKVLTVLEKKLNRIRVTREKLVYDVDYMRKVVNDLYLSKTKVKEEIASRESLETYLDGITFEARIHRSRSVYTQRDSLSNNTVDIKLIRSFSESDLDRFTKLDTARSGNAEDGEEEDYIFQLVQSIQGDIKDVLEAVEDLDQYGRNRGTKCIEPNNNEPSQDLEKYYSDGAEDTEKPFWSLRVVNENEEENMLHSSTEVSSLTKEQVLQNAEASGKAGSIIEKMAGVFRKISSGNASDPPSRKISRNMSENRLANLTPRSHPKNSRASSNQSVLATGNNESQQHLRPYYICENENVCSVVPIPHNTSYTSYGSDSDSAAESGRGLGGNRLSKSARISHPKRTSLLDPNALADFIKVLDDVQQRLGDPNVDYYCDQGTCNGGFIESNETVPPNIRSRSSTSRSRNRKVGIFNPEFKYFSPDLTGAKSVKLGGSNNAKINTS